VLLVVSNIPESDKIRHDDLVESGLMNPTIENFQLLINKIELADQQIIKFGVDLNKSLQGIAPNSVANLQQIFTLSGQINEADKSKIATEQILAELRLKEIEQKNKLKVQYQEEAKAKTAATREAKEQESAYGRLSAKYREAAKLAKDLAAAYGVESKQAKEAARTALNLNNQLKKIAASIGNDQRNVGNYSKAWSGLQSVLGAVGLSLGIGSVINGLKSSIAAFVDAEKNAKALEFALKNVGNEGELAFQKLIKQSEELQANGGVFSDDEIQKAQTQLVNYGLLSDEVETLMPKILDLATAQGVDLATATDTVIKGINGQTKGLKTVGLGFDDTGSRAENYTIILDKLTKFEGAAANAATTTEGKYKVLMNRFDDLKEDIGEFLIDEGAKYLDYWDVLVGNLTAVEMQQKKIIQQTTEKFDPATDAIIAHAEAMESQQEQVVFLNNNMIVLLRTIQNLNAERQKANQEGDTALVAGTSAQIEAIQAQYDKLLAAKNELLSDKAPQDFNDRTGDGDSGAKAAVKKAQKSAKELEYEKGQANKKARLNLQEYENQTEYDREQYLLKEIEDRRLANEEIMEAQEDMDFWLWQQEKETQEKLAEEREKARQEQIEDIERITDAVADGLDRRYDLQEEALKRQGDLIDQEISIQSELFSRGLENNLATQQKLKAENEAKQAQLAEQRAKKEEAMQLASMFLEIVKEDGNVPKALAQTLVARGIADAIAGSFAEGVEDFNGAGTGTSDSNIIRFSNGESVVTAQATAENKGLVSAMNAGKVDDYFNDIYLPQFTQSLKYNGEGAQRGGNWESVALLNEIRELKKVVQNKKETNVELSRTGDFITTTVEQGIKKIVVRKPRSF